MQPAGVNTTICSSTPTESYKLIFTISFLKQPISQHTCIDDNKACPSCVKMQNCFTCRCSRISYWQRGYGLPAAKTKAATRKIIVVNIATLIAIKSHPCGFSFVSNWCRICKIGQDQESRRISDTSENSQKQQYYVKFV